MALDVELVTVASPGSTGAQVVSTSFQPKVLRFWTIGVGSEPGTDSTNAQFMIGAAAPGSGQFACVALFSADNLAALNNHITDGCVLIYDADTLAVIGRAALTSVSGASFTLTWSAVPVSSVNIYAEVLGGADLVQCDVGTFRAPAPFAPHTVSTANGGTPVAIELVSVDAAALDSIGQTPDVNVCVTIGAAVAPTRQWCVVAGFNIDGGPGRITSTNAAATIENPSNFGVGATRVVIGSFSEGAFAVSYSGATASSQVYIGYVAYKGTVAVAAGTFVADTSNATQAVGTSVAVKRVALASVATPESSPTTIISRFALGVGLAGDQRSAAHAAASDVASVAHRQTAAAAHEGIDAGGTVLKQATISSFGPASFTLNWTVTPSTTDVIGYLALGDEQPNTVNGFAAGHIDADAYGTAALEVTGGASSSADDNEYGQAASSLLTADVGHDNVTLFGSESGSVRGVQSGTSDADGHGNSIGSSRAIGGGHLDPDFFGAEAARVRGSEVGIVNSSASGVEVGSVVGVGGGLSDADGYGAAVARLAFLASGHLDPDLAGVEAAAITVGASSSPSTSQSGAATGSVFVLANSYSDLDLYGTAALSVVVASHGAGNLSAVGQEISSVTVTESGFSDSDAYGVCTVYVSDQQANQRQTLLRPHVATVWRPIAVTSEGAVGERLVAVWSGVCGELQIGSASFSRDIDGRREDASVRFFHDAPIDIAVNDRLVIGANTYIVTGVFGHNITRRAELIREHAEIN